MPIERVDTETMVLDIYKDMLIKKRIRNPGPPERIDGMTLGVVMMKASDQSPHDGEMHPDGDEIILVISGKIRVSYDSGEDPIDLGEGQTCIISKGEWHKIDCLEDSRFIHITLGPRGEARFS